METNRVVFFDVARHRLGTPSKHGCQQDKDDQGGRLEWIRCSSEVGCGLCACGETCTGNYERSSPTAARGSARRLRTPDHELTVLQPLPGGSTSAAACAAAPIPVVLGCLNGRDVRSRPTTPGQPPSLSRSGRKTDLARPPAFGGRSGDRALGGPPEASTYTTLIHRYGYRALLTAAPAANVVDVDVL